MVWRSRGGGGGGGGGGGIVVQDMLSKGSVEHVLWSSDDGGKNHLRSRGGPEGRVHEWYWLGEAPRPVGHICVSWRWRSLVPAGFSLHPAPCDTDGPAGSTRWPFSRLVFHGAGAGSCRRIARHPPAGRCHPLHRPVCLCQDGKQEMGGKVPVIARPNRPPTGFVGAHFPP